MTVLSDAEIEATSGGVVPLAVYFIAGVVIGAGGTSVGLYWATR
jgi:lactobin A/cerein 7B family class IIb bacteriocin